MKRYFSLFIGRLLNYNYHEYYGAYLFGHILAIGMGGLIEIISCYILAQPTI